MICNFLDPVPAISFQKYHDIIAYIVAGQIYHIAGVIIMVIPKSLLQSIMTINIFESVETGIGHGEITLRHP